MGTENRGSSEGYEPVQPERPMISKEEMGQLMAEDAKSWNERKRTKIMADAAKVRQPIAAALEEMAEVTTYSQFVAAAEKLAAKIDQLTVEDLRSYAQLRDLFFQKGMTFKTGDLTALKRLDLQVEKFVQQEQTSANRAETAVNETAKPARGAAPPPAAGQGLIGWVRGFFR